MKTIYINKTGTNFSVGGRYIQETGHAGYKSTSPIGMWYDSYTVAGSKRCCAEYNLENTYAGGYIDETRNFYALIKFKTSTLGVYGNPSNLIGMMTDAGVFEEGLSILCQIDRTQFRAAGFLTNPGRCIKGLTAAYTIVANTEYYIRLTFNALIRTLTAELYNGTNTILLATSSITFAAGQHFACNYIGMTNDRVGYLDTLMNTGWSDYVPDSDNTWTIEYLYADNNEQSVNQVIPRNNIQSLLMG